MRYLNKNLLLCVATTVLATQPALADSNWVKTRDRFGQSVLIATPVGMSIALDAPRNALEVKNPYHLHPDLLRQVVPYSSEYPAGSIVVDTDARFLYLILPQGRAMRYGVGVARAGFEWSGTNKVTAKREWPDWRPPEQMRLREPHLPEFMPGGANNPLGARAIYIGDTLYRLHGTTHPWSIGKKVSSGCIRLTNEDIIDLYQRIHVGNTVVVTGNGGS